MYILYTAKLVEHTLFVHKDCSTMSAGGFALQCFYINKLMIELLCNHVHWVHNIDKAQDLRVSTTQGECFIYASVS